MRPTPPGRASKSTTSSLGRWYSYYDNRTGPTPPTWTSTTSCPWRSLGLRSASMDHQPKAGPSRTTSATAGRWSQSPTTSTSRRVTATLRPGCRPIRRWPGISGPGALPWGPPRAHTGTRIAGHADQGGSGGCNAGPSSSAPDSPVCGHRVNGGPPGRRTRSSNAAKLKVGGNSSVQEPPQPRRDRPTRPCGRFIAAWHLDEYDNCTFE
jgi:hypothetical protein